VNQNTRAQGQARGADPAHGGRGLVEADLVGVAALGGPAADLAGQDFHDGAGLGEHQHRGDERREQHLDGQAGGDAALAAEALGLGLAREDQDGAHDLGAEQQQEGDDHGPGGGLDLAPVDQGVQRRPAGRPW
jgi:hypothetical protein